MIIYDVTILCDTDMETSDVYFVCCFFKIRNPSFFWIDLFSPYSDRERVKDKVKEEDRRLLLLSGFRDYHKDSELTLIQQDCHSS